MTDHTQLELQRLEGELDKVRRRLEELQDVTRAAQRLYDEIHLAGKTHVTVTNSVTAHMNRPPGSETYSIQSHGPALREAIENLGDALKTLYTA